MATYLCRICNIEFADKVHTFCYVTVRKNAQSQIAAAILVAGPWEWFHCDRLAEAVIFIYCVFCSVEIDRSAAKNIYTIVYRLSRERKQILKIGAHYDVPSGQISIGTHFFRKLNKTLTENAMRMRTPARPLVGLSPKAYQ